MPICSTLKRILASLAAVFTLTLALPAAAEPALWVVKDADSTIYLFGTIHMLKPNVAWKSPKIAKALEDSQDLTLEIADLDPNPATLIPLIQKYGLDVAHPLSSKLTAAENAKLARACDLYGKTGMGTISPAMLEPLRPWLVSLQLSLLPVVQAGYDPKAGVDMLLKAEADRRGIPVMGFETMEQQLAYFASMPPEVELQYLRSTLDQLDEVVPQLNILAGAWEAGDVNAIGKLMNAELSVQAPAVYDLILVHRNEDFARQIKARLAGHGVSFVAVGAAHLAGKDSVQAKLAKLGVKAVRL